MNADYAARVASDGQPLASSDIANHHQQVFSDYGLDINAWTATLPLHFLGPDAWTQMLNPTGIGAARTYAQLEGSLTADADIRAYGGPGY